MTLSVATAKEDIQRIIDDWIQVRNRNFVQSTELVREEVSSGVISAFACFLNCLWVSL